LLINFTGGPDMSLYEVNEAASLIHEEAHEDANIILGAVIDDRLTDEIRVTVIATGFGELERASMSQKYSPSGTPVTTPIMASSTRPVDAGELRPLSSATLSGGPQPIRPFPGRPVRKMGMVVDDSTLDIPAFKRRGDTPVLDEKLEPERLADPEDKLDVPTFLRKHID
jgi:cell division protein FtsZ